MIPLGEFSEEQVALRQMLSALGSDRDFVCSDQRYEQVTSLAIELSDLGLWTLGVSPEFGGGGADSTTVAIAFEQLGRFWPSLGWAAVQAHAALDLLSGEKRSAEVCRMIGTRAAGIAVVEASSSAVRLEWDRDRLVGTVGRVDAAHTSPYLLVLSGDDEALLISPEGLTATPVQRTGLGGALTRSLSVNASRASVVHLQGVAVGAAVTRMRLGVAAVAVGLSAGASEDALAYTSERHQFGDVLTAIPTVRASLLEQSSRVATMSLAVRAAGDDELTALALARESCAAAVETCAAALQSYGGYGYLAEFAAERRLRDAVSLRAAANVEGGAAASARTLVGMPAGLQTIEEKA